MPALGGAAGFAGIVLPVRSVVLLAGSLWLFVALRFPWRRLGVAFPDWFAPVGFGGLSGVGALCFAGLSEAFQSGRPAG